MSDGPTVLYRADAVADLVCAAYERGKTQERVDMCRRLEPVLNKLNQAIAALASLDDHPGAGGSMGSAGSAGAAGKSLTVPTARAVLREVMSDLIAL